VLDRELMEHGELLAAPKAPFRRHRVDLARRLFMRKILQPSAEEDHTLKLSTYVPAVSGHGFTVTATDCRLVGVAKPVGCCTEILVPAADVPAVKRPEVLVLVPTEIVRDPGNVPALELLFTKFTVTFDATFCVATKLSESSSCAAKTVNGAVCPSSKVRKAPVLVLYIRIPEGVRVRLSVAGPKPPVVDTV